MEAVSHLGTAGNKVSTVQHHDIAFLLHRQFLRSVAWKAPMISELEAGGSPAHKRSPKEDTE